MNGCKILLQARVGQYFLQYNKIHFFFAFLPLLIHSGVSLYDQSKCTHLHTSVFYKACIISLSTCAHLLAGTGTADYEVYPCPNGTFSNNTGLKDEDGCLDCTAGWACVGLALTEPNVLCQAGYYCQGRAKTPTPLDTITGDKCPEGYYCPQGQGIIISF